MRTQPYSPYHLHQKSLPAALNHCSIQIDPGKCFAGVVGSRSQYPPQSTPSASPDAPQSDLLAPAFCLWQKASCLRCRARA